MRILVAGWFSFDEMGASAGDLMARDLACEWIKCAGFTPDVALAPPFAGGVDWRSVDPNSYSFVVFVCGPLGNGWPVTEFFEYFAGSRFIGLNLSMLDSLDAWNPFDLLLERDSSATARPDISFSSMQARVPVVGLTLINAQPEYGDRDKHREANRALRRLVASRQMSAVEIDTRLDVNKTGLRTAAEVESLIARMDVILTTRLHGMVLALKNGVPPVVIDSVEGGAKILRQGRTIDWPVLRVESLTDEELRQAFEYCLTDVARARARVCCDRALEVVAGVRDQFVAALTASGMGSRS
jgi:hypothetical protein